MSELLHITEASVWKQAEADGAFTSSTKGKTLADEGFIHMSHRHQLRAVAELLYGKDPATDLVVLVVDGDRVEAPVRIEPAAPGGAESYPHVYGPIPIGAVVDVVTVTRDADGRMVLPE